MIVKANNLGMLAPSPELWSILRSRFGGVGSVGDCVKTSDDFDNLQKC